MSGGICYGSASGRPLGDHSSQKTISDCIKHAAGYKYFGLGCPTGGGFECWRGNDVNDDSIALDMQECTGTPLTNIGNGAANGGCSGYPTGTFTVDYHGVAVPLGGWHREPVYDRAAFEAWHQEPTPTEGKSVCVSMHVPARHSLFCVCACLR